MHTYIINTSENKTFDTDSLFRLVGYKKITWIKCPLNKLEEVARQIIDRQSALDSEKFQVAVIVDFYEFNVKKAYGKNGEYKESEGVDASIYFPFIESYIIDHLFYFLECHDTPVSHADIFYIENVKENRYDLFVNRPHGYINPEGYAEEDENETPELFEQIKRVLSPNIKDEDKKHEFNYTEKAIKNYNRSLTDEQYQKDLKEEKALESGKKENKNGSLIKKVEKYSSFILKCNDNLELEFKTSDYPYSYPNFKDSIDGKSPYLDDNGTLFLTLEEFFKAFVSRTNDQKELIERKFNTHHYYTGVTINQVSASYDVFSLSLYIISKYEREEEIVLSNDDEAKRANPTLLKEILETAWNKIRAAKVLAQSHDTNYYDIAKIAESFSYDLAFIPLSEEEEKNKIRASLKEGLMVEGFFEQYNEIMNIANRDHTTMSKDQWKEINDSVKEYMNLRDATRDNEEIRPNIDKYNPYSGSVTNQCPSTDVVNNVLDNIGEKSSSYINEVLNNYKFISQDFAEEKKIANKCVEDYKKYQELSKRNMKMDIIGAICVLIVCLVPFIVLNSIYNGFSMVSLINYLVSLGIFLGAFILSLILVVIPYRIKMLRIKRKMKDCYEKSVIKNEYTIALIKKVFKEQLLLIEETKSNRKLILRMQEANNKINEKADIHRIMLDDIDNKLATLLNNLGVQPSVMNNISVKNEFDISKPFSSEANKVYHIFTIDVINSLFEDKKKR